MQVEYFSLNPISADGLTREISEVLYSRDWNEFKNPFAQLLKDFSDNDIDYPGVEYTDHVFSYGDPNVNIDVRLYCSTDIDTANDKPSIFYIHGGGWTTGSISMYHGLAQRLAVVLKTKVVTFNYRLVTGEGISFADIQKDCLYTYDFAAANLLKGEQIVLMGDSAGGGMVPPLYVDLCRQEHYSMPIMNILLYPVLDLTQKPSEYDSYKKYAKGYFLSRETMKVARLLYAKKEENFTLPRVSTFYLEPDMMPKTLVISAECDMLCSEAREYSKKLYQLGIDVKHIVYEGVIHCFAQLHQLTESQHLLQQLKIFIDDATALDV